MGLAAITKGLAKRNERSGLFHVYILRNNGTGCKFEMSFSNIPQTDTAVMLSQDDIPIVLAGDQLRIGTREDAHPVIIELPRPTHLSQSTYRIIQSAGRKIMATVRYADSGDIIDYLVDSSVSLSKTCPVKRMSQIDLYLLNVADDGTVTTVGDEWPYPLVRGPLCSNLSLLTELKLRPKQIVIAHDTALVFSDHIQVYPQHDELHPHIIPLPADLSPSLFQRPIVSLDEKRVGIIVEKFTNVGLFSRSERLSSRKLLVYETGTWILVNTIPLPISGFVEAAFAVDGKQMAVLSNDDVSFYELK